MKKSKLLIVTSLCVVIVSIFTSCTGPQSSTTSSITNPSSTVVTTSTSTSIVTSTGVTTSTGFTTSTVTITTTLAAIAGTSAVEAAHTVQPFIVRLDITGQGFTAGGSGFFVDSRGYIMTNQHVVANSTSIKATTLDGTQYAGTVVNTDSNRDLAMIKLSATKNNFPVVTLGNSASAQVGQDVLAVGFPLGTDLPGPATFNRGIISAFRNYSGLNYIQSDTASKSRR